MTTCPKCECELDIQRGSGSVTCSGCGASFDVVAGPSAGQGPTTPPPLPPQSSAETIYCTLCGEQNLENNYRCVGCGEFLHEVPPPPGTDLSEDVSMRMLLPVGRSGWAIASGYLGLFSVLAVPGPFALLTGLIAVREIRRNDKLHGMGRAIFGIIAGGIGTLLLILVIFAFAAGH